MLVTLQQARDQLRSDTAADDADLTLKVHAASAAVLNYLKGANRFEPELDETGAVVVDELGAVVYTTDILFEVQAAVLLMVGYLYRLRDADPDRDFEPGYLPRPVTALLYPLRDPALA